MTAIIVVYVAAVAFILGQLLGQHVERKAWTTAIDRPTIAFYTLVSRNFEWRNWGRKK
jgi:hypothetical protein